MKFLLSFLKRNDLKKKIRVQKFNSAPCISNLFHPFLPIKISEGCILIYYHFYWLFFAITLTYGVTDNDLDFLELLHVMCSMFLTSVLFRFPRAAELVEEKRKIVSIFRLLFSRTEWTTIVTNFFLLVESLFNLDSVSTYKNAGLSIHILASIFNFRHTGNRMFAILWWQYCEFSNLLQKKRTTVHFLPM